MPEGANPASGSDTKAPEPKFEIKEGKVLVDGHSYVKEADLIAAKRSLESQIADQQKVHTEAYDKARLELSSAQQQIAASSAKIKELTEAQGKGASEANSAELTKAREELKSAQEEAKVAKELGVNYRKKLLTVAGGVPEDTLKDMSMSDLDGLEKALTILGKAKGGLGNYATGGGNGGSSTPLTSMDRAKALLAATPIAGVRNSSQQ
jgi:multidrug efflux pump subunit AcrA (membrane-fusion protein)